MMKKDSLIKDLERKDLNLDVLKSIVSEFWEGENEFNYKIRQGVSNKILSREISPIEGFQLIRGES